jgi:hypothetical protein
VDNFFFIAQAGNQLSHRMSVVLITRRVGLNFGFERRMGRFVAHEVSGTKGRSTIKEGEVQVQTQKRWIHHGDIEGTELTEYFPFGSSWLISPTWREGVGS